MIGPMIGSSSRMPAITESRIAYWPKIGSTVRLRMIRPMNVKIPTAKPRTSWPRTHWPKTRSTVRSRTQVSNLHAGGSARSNAWTSATRSLSR